MEQISATVKNVLCSLERRKNHAPEAELEEGLKKLLTKKELGHIRIKYFRKGILNIGVDSSAWLYHLSLRKDELLSRLSQGNPELKSLRFCIGETKWRKKRK